MIQGGDFDKGNVSGFFVPVLLLSFIYCLLQISQMNAKWVKNEAKEGRNVIVLVSYEEYITIFFCVG